MRISLKKIKGVGAIIAFSGMAICNPAEGAQAVSVITPIITEFAIDLWPKIAKSVRSLATQEGQCKLCSKTGGLSCASGLIKRSCKTRCQERVEMGSGYILKIRFAGKWNMRTCMEAEKKACMEAVRKKKKKEADCISPSSAGKEIAVYNAHDLKIAKDLITTIVASDHIIARNGKVEPKMTKQEAEQERDQALKDLVDKYGEQGNSELVDLKSAQNLITKIANNQMILTSYSKETDAAKTPDPKEKLEEAKKEREQAIASLQNLLPGFGPQ